MRGYLAIMCRILIPFRHSCVVSK